VEGGDPLTAAFADGCGEGIVGWSETVVRCDNEQRLGGEFRNEIHKVPPGGVDQKFVSETLRSSASEWRHALSCESGSDTFDGKIVFVGRNGLKTTDAKIGCGDRNNGFEGWIERSHLESPEASHAMPEENDSVRVGAKFRSVGGVAQVGYGGLWSSME
jgi:hypothetical protein